MIRGTGIGEPRPLCMIFAATGTAQPLHLTRLEPASRA